MSAATSWAHRSLNPTTWAGHWPRIGGSVPRPRSSPAKATKATGRAQRPSPKPRSKAARKQLVGKAPLGSLPARKGRSAASSEEAITDEIESLLQKLAAKRVDLEYLLASTSDKPETPEI